MLAGCTGSIHIANSVMSSGTTTRFFLHLMIIVGLGGREGEKGGQGNVDEKERPALL